MTATETSAGMSGGEPLIPAEHHLTDDYYTGPRCVECYAAIGDIDDEYCPYCPEPAADAGGDR